MNVSCLGSKLFPRPLKASYRGVFCSALGVFLMPRLRFFVAFLAMVLHLVVPWRAVFACGFFAAGTLGSRARSSPLLLAFPFALALLIGVDHGTQFQVRSCSPFQCRYTVRRIRCWVARGSFHMPFACAPGRPLPKDKARSPNRVCCRIGNLPDPSGWRCTVPSNMHISIRDVAGCVCQTVEVDMRPPL